MKRVLIIEGERLLVDGVVSLLSGGNGIHLLNKTVSDEPALVNEIEAFQPSVIIVDERSPFANLSLVHGVLKNYPKLRVIVIDERENFIHIYNKQSVTVNRSADLICAIHRV